MTRESFQEQPYFSIITVTLNNIAGLRTTYKSIQNQTLKKYEWIVIDGNSTDTTREWLKDKPARIISEPDEGIYDAMNKGIESSSGRFLIFLNGGDEFAQPQTLEKITKAIGDTKPDFIYGDALENGRNKIARHHSKITHGMITHHQAMLYSRDAIADMRYNLHYKIAADYDFTARLLKRTNNVLYCPFPICIFEQGGISQINAAQGRKEEAQIRQTLELSSPLGNMLTALRQKTAHVLKSHAPWLYHIMR